jgi:hypothetical protein
MARTYRDTVIDSGVIESAAIMRAKTIALTAGFVSVNQIRSSAPAKRATNL